jgi:peptide/nickel transport system substrate-binding protein
MTRALPMTERVIVLERVDFLPSNRVTDDASILTLKSLVFEPLCRWHEGLVRPALFARWSHDGSGRTWRFEIRENARFHDGTPCTAADILAFIEAILDSRDMFGMKWSYARYFEHTRFSVLSDTTLGVSSPHPFADMLDVFSEFYISKNDAAGLAVLGTGPYRIAEFTPQDRAILEPVHGNDTSRLMAIAVPSAEERLRRVRAGEADIACGLELLERGPDFGDDLTWHRATGTLSVMYYLNCATGFFRSTEARRAINHAVDKTRIVRDLFGGLAEPAATIVSPFHLGYRDAAVAPLAYDPDMARRLLDRAGPSGELVLRTPHHMPARALWISLMVQDALAEVGVRVRLDEQPDRPEYAREIGAGHMGDLAIFDSSPHSTYRVLNDKISSTTHGVWWQGYENPEIETLIRAANDSVEDGDRAAAYGRCLSRLNADPPWLYLFHPVGVLATRLRAGIGLDHKGILKLDA